LFKLFPDSALVASFSPPDKYWWDELERGLELHRGQETLPLVTLGVGAPSPIVRTVSDAAGSRLLLGHEDGSATICDIEEVRRRLTGLDLGW
jgi:hypothetical protein